MKDRLDKSTLDWVDLLKHKNNKRNLDRDNVTAYTDYSDNVTVIKMPAKKGTATRKSFATKENYDWLVDYLRKKLILLSWWDAPRDIRLAAENDLNSIEDYKKNYSISRKIALLNEWCNKWLEVGSKTREKTINAIKQNIETRFLKGCK